MMLKIIKIYIYFLKGNYFLKGIPMVYFLKVKNQKHALNFSSKSNRLHNFFNLKIEASNI